MIYANLLHQIAIFVRSVLHKMHYFIIIRRIGANFFCYRVKKVALPRYRVIKVLRTLMSQTLVTP